MKPHFEANGRPTSGSVPRTRGDCQFALAPVRTAPAGTVPSAWRIAKRTEKPLIKPLGQSRPCVAIMATWILYVLPLGNETSNTYHCLFYV